MFQLLYADHKGQMFDHPEVLAGGRTGNIFTEINESEAIPLPEGASLIMIPAGQPVGINAKGDFTGVSNDGRGNSVFAVGALLPQGYTRTLLPAFVRTEKQALPLFGYAAVGWKDNKVYVAAVKTDDDTKWNPSHYSTPELNDLVENALKHYKNNRIISQLSKCALQYNCFTAQNIFYKRWEGGIPVSPSCNARCLGCISLQPAECCPSPQSRISFEPTSDEITEVALTHLNEAEDGIISFGQGCEGEPSLAARTISAAIRQLRTLTGAGTINMNTNAGYTEGVKEVCLAGIDSLRVSTISAREATYGSYYRPQGYNWSDVCSSVAFAHRQGIFISLNLLTFPGLTDMLDEVEALIEFIKANSINMVQIRNLNIDPDLLAAKIPLTHQEAIGITNFIAALKEEVPGLLIGNYSKPVVK